MNYLNLNMILNELSKTPIIKTLSTVHIRKDFFKRRTASSLFKSHGFKVKITADNIWPASLK